MSANESRKHNGRRRRSVRLAQAVTVEIAGRKPDGKVFVEETRTCEISRQGASLMTRNSFSLGSPMAIRRPGAQPARAHVVSVKPGPEPGLLQVGVEFVGSEAYWDCEFPRDWQDSYQPAARDGGPGDAEAEPAAEKLAAARRRISALDESLEGAVRKAETVRAQADTTLQECAAQIEAIRRESAAALATQLDLLDARKSSLEEEFVGQAGAAVEAIRAQLESAQAQSAAEADGLQQKVAALCRQLDAALQTGQEEHQQFLAQAGRKTAELVEQLAAQIEARRKELAELEVQTTQWRGQTAAALGSLQQETERLIHGAHGEMRAATLAQVQEFRRQIPHLGEEASRFFVSMLAEEKAAASRWIEQSLETVRATFAELEKGGRTALAEHARKALEQHNSSLQARLQEARSSGEAVAAALEARVQRARNALGELADWSERAISGAREKLEAVGIQAEARIAEAAAQRLGEMEKAASQSLESLRQQGESVQASGLEAARRLEQSAREFQEMAVSLDRQARQKREELDGLFASLMIRYDHRKEALDRLLEMLESGRTALRAELESLRTSAEENQARLLRFTAEREAALKSKTLELDQKLQAGAIALEAGLQERAAGSLQSLHSAFSAGLEQVAAQGREKFQGILNAEIQRGAERVSELMAALERRAEELSRALEAAASEHLLRFDQARRDIEQRVATELEKLARHTADGEETLKQATAAAVAAVEDRQARAAAAAGEILAGVQQARATLVRENTEIENQSRQRQQSLETQFAVLSSGLEEKRAGLDSFYSYIDRAKAELTQSVASLDRRVEEARSSLHVQQREIQATLDKRAATLAHQLQETLKHSLDACQQEMDAMGEVAHGVFQVRLRSLADQTVAAAEKAMQKAADGCAASLDHALQSASRKHEGRIHELAQEAEEATREQQRVREESVAAAAASLHEQLQQVSRLAIDRVREAHQMLLREIPARLTEAELAFRQSLDKILEQAREDASAALRALSAQLSAQAELEMRRRFYQVLQAPPASDGETP